jgi:RHS repeat-associated protein
LKPTGVATPTEFVWSYIERRIGTTAYAGNPAWMGKQHLRYPYVSQSPILDSDVNGVDWVVSGYNGLQQPDLTIRYVFEGNGSDAKTWQSFTYDNGRRLTDIKFNYATGGAGISSPTYTLSNMVYNFKDQLIEKNIGLTGTSALQSVDYIYNIRGFLTNINNVALYTNGSASIMTPPMNGTSPIQNLAITPFVNKVVQDAVQPYRAANAMELPPVNDNNADLYSQNITYGDPASQTGAAAQNNGNISSTTWQVLGRAKQAYGFTYDGLDRLSVANYYDITEGYQSGVLTSQYSTDNKFKEAVQYDVRGNIVGLQRNGMKTGGWTQNGFVAGTYGVIDNLSYTYNAKNQVINIYDGAVNFSGPSADKDYKGFVYNPSASLTGNNYEYDPNGNLTKDGHKDITSITYNYLNLPQVITLTAGRTIQFVYDATGAKLKKITNDNGTITTFDYINGVEYKNNALQRIPHNEGAVVKNEFGAYEHEYVLRDHLGNNRVTFRDGINKGDAYFDWNTWQYIDPNAGNTTGLNDGVITASDIKQINHFYAFGLNMEGNWQGAAQGPNLYGYNDKEWNNDFGLGLNDYGARFYDPAMARFTSIDPMAEKFIDINPYNYVKNNPVNMIDPTGMESIYTIERNENGGGTITISAKVFLTGSQSSKDAAKAANDKAAEMFKDGKYTDADGQEWTVKVDVKFEQKDNVSRDDLKEGENILNMDGKTDRSEVEGGLGTSPFKYGEMHSGADATETVHEAGHLLGLSDRYSDVGKKSISHEGYEKDLMGCSPTSKATEFMQEHYDDLGSFALRRSADLQYGSRDQTVPVNRFSVSTIIDWRRESGVKK